ncbi:protein of unknown function DUF349 [Hymenobacter roseosalivarius DSM 11622]|uniref:DUF349 domain-containing protein n=1 Tax=Hymenobacter roseosalivarius DSM 11622 TaxID=645990 RepID=A0A1W1W0V7_9BACT|nr:DUF349 domain-containing protein [Hymenobacter roseosalivarius]SMB99245.1 protein of unknown function DUF349 [Hymenobacter roseosalivarius DSM 11622]
MLPDNHTTDPLHSDEASESPMNILERRLAEIRAKEDPAAQPLPPTEAPAPAANVPAETTAAAPSTTTDEITERPAQGTPPLENAPQGAGTAESPAAVVAPDQASTAAEAPARETISEPLARAEAHYGQQNPGVETATNAAAPASVTPEPEAMPAGPVDEAAEAVSSTPNAPQQDSVTPEPEALTGQPTDTATDEPMVPAAPTIALHSAEDLENAPDVVASLPTSATASAAVAAEAAAAHEGEDEEELVAETHGPDFGQLDLAAQASFLLNMVRRPDAQRNRKQITDLYRQHETAVAADRQRTGAAAAPDAEATNHGPAGHAELVKAMQEFRESRARDARAEDEQRAKNFTHKQELLAQLRLLVESAETKDSSARIKTLQNDWKSTGPVPQKDAQELWNSYHALLDIYYNNRGLFFEMKELDRRRNLEAKEALLRRAEALSEQPSINKALQELRQLHEEWKHIGPVPNEQRDAIWQRFLQASEQVHDRKKNFLDTRSTEENANLTRKTALLEQIRSFGDFQTERVNEWRGKTDELQKLKEEWDAAGLVPRDKADQLNKQFWGAYKGFFQRKNQFFKALDEEKGQNLKRKLDLCDQAEAALENSNWEEGREIVIRLQKEWKLIGRVPEKQSDKVWNRFRTACDAFFDRKNQEVKQREVKAQLVSQEQAAHLDRVADAVAALSADNPGTLEGFRQQITEWRASGAAGGPRAEEKFQTLMGKYLDMVPNLAYADRGELLFQLQVERLKSGPDAQQALYKKEQGLRRDINELENDIATLQTNLEFFARSKNANQLREEYQGRIDEAKVRIDALKKQLKIVRS